MATKFFCDCCNKETKHRPNQFEYLIHLDDMTSVHGYVDSDWNRISGRTVVVDLCNKCYNDVVSVAVQKFKELRKGG